MRELLVSMLWGDGTNGYQLRVDRADLEIEVSGQAWIAMCERPGTGVTAGEGLFRVEATNCTVVYELRDYVHSEDYWTAVRRSIAYHKDEQ